MGAEVTLCGPATLIPPFVEDLGVDVSPRTQLLGVEIPAQRQAGIKVSDVAQLVDKLKNEAKVIS